jgi:PAS domain S-box-containing protein
MSEFINNSENRVKDLLAFSLGIMNGEDGKVLIEKYKAAIEHITPYDMLALEDKQMQMGITPKLIKKDVEKVLNVFYNSLEKFPWKKPDEDTFLYHLMLENEALIFKLNQLKKIFKKYRGEENEKFIQMQKELLPLFKELVEFEIHYVKKENILFPYLEKKWKSYRPLSVMWSLHDDIRKNLKSIISMLENPNTKWEDFNQKLGEYFFLTFGMVQKENLIIFPVAAETVDEAEWIDMYNQSFEYPFPFIEKPKKVEKSIKEQQTAHNFGEQNLGFQTETGNLSFEQVLLAFNHLPVDITFVDENDKVRFFSKAKDRFFPRSPAIVGRDVRNCHPPESVHIVEKIIEEFKKGNRDVADFRIKMRGKYILIRYFAMRNEAGEYKGILEVGEDITEISKMNDEKRLLDWK